MHVMFDVILFLNLPIDIRLEVYKHLLGQFTCLDPLSTGPRVRIDTPEQWKLQEERFTFYLAHYEYLNDFIPRWLSYTPCLRYDCIVLDYLRINLLYESGLSKMHWIELDDGDPYLAAFDNREDVLQVWYTPREYASWIICKSPQGIADDNNEFTTTSLDLGLLKNCKLLCQSLPQQYLDSVILVTLTQEELISEGHLHESIKYLISHMEQIRYLRCIRVRSDFLLRKLINLRGHRDNPGHMIPYTVRKRIREIEVLGLQKAIVEINFTKWENCLVLKLENCAITIDLNKIILPRQLRYLSIKKVQAVKWWNIKKGLLQSNFDEKREKGRVIKMINKSMIDQEKYFKMQDLITGKLQNLNHITIQEVQELLRDIVVPSRLYYSNRVNIFQCHVDEITVV
ncbi:HBL044Cp [Eremothecium sinecaudum]|uniref:HBL044Cp n=1 Tax=Eremothecium sinecaudum TaxID=45286 RepID=A0A109UWI2_9SACH|nr:HBL044Cp [Eremothecium sinecaudum]AMD18858.1 HBL044Cp [Eremothecium sinecaudum]